MNATLEPGLPGTGPLPVHIHTGKPTPWSEGCVVHFFPDSASSWIGNLQKGFGYATKIIAWEEAKAFIVIAKGATYFIRPDAPDDWRFLDLLGIDCILSPSHHLALLATYRDVVAVSTNGIPLWRTSVAIEGIEDIQVNDYFVIGKAGIDPPDEWWPFALWLHDGTNVAPHDRQYFESSQ